MKRLLVFYFLLLMASSWLTSCRTKKDISQTSTQTDSTSITSISDETTISNTLSLIDSEIEGYENRFNRVGIFDIQFDSLTNLHISPDGDIRATGYAPTIRSHTSQTYRETASITSTSSQLIQEDSTGKREVSEEKVTTIVAKTKEKEVTRTPSLIPWIGAGLVGVMLILAIAWYFFGKRAS